VRRPSTRPPPRRTAAELRVDYSITLNDLKFRSEWDPLRDDPRFQELIAQHDL
jgi:hypothetical protein